MPASKHWLDILHCVEQARFDDALSIARRSIESDDFRSLVESIRNDPMQPDNRHRRLVEEELAKPQTAQLYLKIKRSLWSWPEFAAVSRRAMTILQVVVELARDEALPWYVAVAAEEVRRLARMSTRQYVRAVHELESLAITRPARPIQLAGPDGTARFPGILDEREFACGFAQWVIRYRHGTPWNKKRAAWWINYDLLCETGRVYQCFMVLPSTLSKPYRSRNRNMGTPREGWVNAPADSDGMIALEESLSRNGPLPPSGLRAPLWRPEVQHS